MAERSTTRERSSVLAVVRETALIVALSLLIATLVRIFLVQAFLIPSSSMEDTLLVEDRVLVSKLSTRIGGPGRGDVVVFADPGGWLGAQPESTSDDWRSRLRDALVFVGVLPSSTEGHLIKRVIGVGGDTVQCCDAQDRLSVNGVPVDESSYLYPGDSPSLEEFTETVPPGQLWVMGDHRSNSGDSRVHGPIPVDSVVGRAVLVVWPFSRLAVLDRPDVLSDVPAAAAAP